MSTAVLPQAIRCFNTWSPSSGQFWLKCQYGITSAVHSEIVLRITCCHGCISPCLPSMTENQAALSRTATPHKRKRHRSWHGTHLKDKRCQLIKHKASRRGTISPNGTALCFSPQALTCHFLLVWSRTIPSGPHAWIPFRTWKPSVHGLTFVFHLCNCYWNTASKPEVQ